MFASEFIFSHMGVRFLLKLTVRSNNIGVFQIICTESSEEMEKIAEFTLQTFSFIFSK